MAKTTTLRERGSLQPLYPKTISSQVILPDGHNLDHELSKQSNVLAVPAENRIEEIEPGIITEALRKVPQVLTPEEQEQVKANIGVSKMELFIDMWNEACRAYGYYDEATGYFELNGLTDITYEEAQKIYSAYVGDTMIRGCRTNLPLPEYYDAPKNNGRRFTNTDVEIINARLDYDVEILNTHSLREISTIYLIDTNANNFLVQSRSLEYVRFTHQNHSPKVFSRFDIRNASNFRLDGMAQILEWVRDSTITVHPNIYAKLTDEANTQWHQILLDAAEKNINFATV
ncbi:hypothetical protein [Duncaniella muris]|uniref:hypothetical protein n=1 Tax=Duncaniella muris TaxID=2094150 RepID=UPI002675064E|nr:hypothetical protein [Duncaniella muris]